MSAEDTGSDTTTGNDTNTGSDRTIARGKAATLTAAALVAGLTLGGMGLAYATSDTVSVDSTATAEAPFRGGGDMHSGGHGGHGAGRAGGLHVAGVVADLTSLDVDDIRDRRAAGESLAAIAESEGVETADVAAQALEDISARLEERVDAGDITEDEKADLLAEAEDRIAEELESTEALPEPPAGDAADADRPGGRDGRGGDPIGVVVELTDLDAQDVMDRRTDGESLADIAASAGVETADVQAALVDRLTTQLDEIIASGDLTEEQKTTILADAQERFAEMLESTDALPDRGGREGHRGDMGEEPGESGDAMTATD